MNFQRQQSLNNFGDKFDFQTNRKVRVDKTKNAYLTKLNRMGLGKDAANDFKIFVLPNPEAITLVHYEKVRQCIYSFWKIKRMAWMQEQAEALRNMSKTMELRLKIARDKCRWERALKLIGDQAFCKTVM